MGTRSLTIVYSEWEDEKLPMVCMYRQYDGYMEGHGLELAKFLAPYTIVNGLGRDNGSKIANGMGCLAAQMVAHFKTEAGQFYLYPPTPGLDAGQDYEYHVFNNKVVVHNHNHVVFEGTWAEFYSTCAKKEADYMKKYHSN